MTYTVCKEKGEKKSPTIDGLTYGVCYGATERGKGRLEGRLELQAKGCAAGKGKTNGTSAET